MGGSVLVGLHMKGKLGGELFALRELATSGVSKPQILKH